MNLTNDVTSKCYIVSKPYKDSEEDEGNLAKKPSLTWNICVRL